MHRGLMRPTLTSQGPPGSPGKCPHVSSGCLQLPVSTSLAQPPSLLCPVMPPVLGARIRPSTESDTTEVT